MNASELSLLLSNFEINQPLRAELDELVERHRTREQREQIAGALLDKAIFLHRSGTREGWISLGLMADHVGLSVEELKPLLIARGYVDHPCLKGGRTDNPVTPDGKRARLMLKAGHFSLQHTKQSLIATAYQTAQGLNI